jgi:hypothetical protein
MVIRGPALKPKSILPPTTPGAGTEVAKASETQKTTEVKTTELKTVEDGYEGQGAAKSETPVNAAMREATERYQGKLDYILGHSPKAMAEGRLPFRQGDELSPDQQSALQRETKKFAKDMPIGAFSPETVSRIREFAEAHGVDTTNLEGMSINDLGDVAGDIGENIAKDFAGKVKSKNPAVYFGVLGGAAAAIGAYGITQGSEALRKIGIRPQIKTDLFNDRITAKVKAAWDPGLKNPVLGLYGQSNFNLNNGARLSVGGGVVGATGDKTASGGWEVIGAEVNAQYRTENLNLYARGFFNAKDHNVGTDGRRQRVQLSGHAPEQMRSAFDGGHQSHIKVGGSYVKNDWATSAYYQRNLDTNTFQTGLSAGYRPNENVELQVMGGYNSQTKDGHVGMGLRVRF